MYQFVNEHLLSIAYKLSLGLHVFVLSNDGFMISIRIWNGVTFDHMVIIPILLALCRLMNASGCIKKANHKTILNIAAAEAL